MKDGMEWQPFPWPEKAYAYSAAGLRKHWERLHRGDRAPLAASAEVLNAWRSYHAGEFAMAFKQGLACGIPGDIVACKAAAIYANYLETDIPRKLAILLEVAQRCEEMQAEMPEDPNGWYLHAYALGRYSQGISVARALARGLAGKIRSSLERALMLEPRHAEAHVALGTYHAEIIDKVGALVGGLTYGAKKDAAIACFRKALELNPDSAIARIEFARGLLMIDGRAHRAEAGRLYREATECVPLDAMERLDVELARAEMPE